MNIYRSCSHGSFLCTFSRSSPINHISTLIYNTHFKLQLSTRSLILSKTANMFAQPILLLGLTAFTLTLADPIPAPAPAATTAMTYPTDPAGVSSMLASESSLESILSGMPTLPASVESVLLTAAPTSADTACETTTPGWYKSLPPDVKSALTSYESAFESWYTAHSSQLGAVMSTSVGLGLCSGASVAATATAKTASSTGTAKATNTATVSSGNGTAASTSSSQAGAAPTGVIGAGIAGVVGVLGIMAAL